MNDDTRALTGIRGIAAIWVMAGHYTSGFDGMPFTHLFEKCYLAVDLFFVLSGFVIALNNGRIFVASEPSDACFAFYRRRIARIYPLFAVALLMTLAHRAATGAAMPSAAGLITNLTMTQAWFSIRSILNTGWSVSVETFAYLAFPWIAAFVFRRSAPCANWIVLAAWGGLAWLCALDPVVHFGELNPGGPLDICDGGIYPMLRCLFGFSAGVGAYRLAGVPRVKAALGTRGLPEALIGAIAFLAWKTDLDLPIAMMFTVLVAALAQPGHFASRALRSRPAMMLGDLSYAIYLSHTLVGFIVRDALVGTMPWPFVLVCCAVAALAAAFVLHTFVEKPCHAFIRNRSQAKSLAPVVAPA